MHAGMFYPSITDTAKATTEPQQPIAAQRGRNVLYHAIWASDNRIMEELGHGLQWTGAKTVSIAAATKTEGRGALLGIEVPL